MTNPTNEVEQVRWVPVLNDSGEVIPAFAAMRVSGYDGASGSLTVAKPNANDAVNVLFNGPVEIGVGLQGVGMWGVPATARYEESDGTPSAGQEWGVESGGWKLRNARAGYLVAGSLGAGFAAVMYATPPAGEGGGSELDTFFDSDGNTSVSLTVDDQWETFSGITVTLAAAGKWLVTCEFNSYLQVDSGGAFATGNIQFRLYNFTQSSVVETARLVNSNAGQTDVIFFQKSTLAFFADVAAGDGLVLQARRTNTGCTYTQAEVGGGGSDNDIAVHAVRVSS